jgi:hypothetical protein
MEYVSCGRAAVQRLLTPGETVIEGWPAVNTVPMRVRGGERESTTVAGPPSAGGLIFTHIFGFCDSAGIFKEGKTNRSNP